jgi:hypothetical protein
MSIPCTVPASVSVTGTSAVTATMTINSTPPGSAPFAALSLKRIGRLAASFSFALAGMLLFAIPARGRRRLTWLGLILLAISGAGTLMGCGGGNAAASANPLPGTTPGNYAFTVTASTPGPNAATPTVTVTGTVSVMIQ